MSGCTIRRVRLRGRSRSARAQTPHQLSISEEWEAYARKHRAREFWLGDEWNKPEAIGMDVAPDEVVPTMDARVFEPFLGTCGVLLEIGAGGGRFTQVLVERCDRLIAADTSPTMLEILGERFAGDSRLEPTLLDGKGLSGIADASVDRVFSYGVFVHLQHCDMFNYLRESHRVLRPGGRGVIQHANTFSDLGWRRFLFDLTISLDRHKPGGTYSVMTPEIMAELVGRAGLVVEKIDSQTAKRDSITLFSKP